MAENTGHQEELLGIEDLKTPGFRWNLKRHRFCLLWVQNGGVGSQAAKDAGYSEDCADQISNDLLSREPIRRAIQKHLRDHLTRHALSQDSIVASWVSWWKASPYDFVKVSLLEALRDADGNIVKDENGQTVMNPFGASALVAKGPDELTPEQKRCVKKLKITNNQFGQNVEVELHDASAALDRLARLAGLVDKDSGDSPSDVAQSVRNALAEMMMVDGLADVAPGQAPTKNERPRPTAH